MYAFKLFLHVLENKFFNFIGSIYGLFADLQLVFSLKNFFNSIGCSNITFINVPSFNVDFRFLFLMNMSLVCIEEVDFVILVGTDLRLEAPLLASRLRKACITNNLLKIYSFGLAISNYFLTVNNVGNSIKSLFLFFAGKSRFIINFFFYDFYNFIFLNFSSFLFEKPVAFLGSGNASRVDFVSVMNSFLELSHRFLIQNDIFFVNVISNNLGLLSGCELGALCQLKKCNYKFLYIINADFLFWGKGFFVYQGSFVDSDYIFLKFDLILPCSIFLEQNIIFLNLEGRYRYSRSVISAVGEAKTDFDICQALSILRVSHIKFNFSILFRFFKIMKIFYLKINYECSLFATFQDFCNIFPKIFTVIVLDSYYFFIKLLFFFKFLNTIFFTVIANYYSFDIFAKNSKILSLAAAKVSKSNFAF
jgi:hypothetical protein